MLRRRCLKVNNEIELFIQLAFETGRAYERLYTSLDLYNIINFNDIAYAQSFGAEFKFKGDMSNMGDLFKTHITGYTDKVKFKELNKLADNIKQIKTWANQLCDKRTKAAENKEAVA